MGLNREMLASTHTSVKTITYWREKIGMRRIAGYGTHLTEIAKKVVCKVFVNSISHGRTGLVMIFAGKKVR